MGEVNAGKENGGKHKGLKSADTAWVADESIINILIQFLQYWKATKARNKSQDMVTIHE